MKKPIFEDYFRALPYLVIEKEYDNEIEYKAVDEKDYYRYSPVLHKYADFEWGVCWEDVESSDYIKEFRSFSMMDVIKKAYNWCIKKGFIKDKFK